MSPSADYNDNIRNSAAPSADERTELSEEDIIFYETAFDDWTHYELDAISVASARALLASLYFHLTAGQENYFFDGKEELDVDDFLDIIECLPRISEEERLRTAFNILKEGRTENSITVATFRSAMNIPDNCLSPAEIEDLVKKMDPGETGVIEFEKYRDALMRKDQE